MALLQKQRAGISGRQFVLWHSSHVTRNVLRDTTLGLRGQDVSGGHCASLRVRVFMNQQETESGHDFAQAFNEEPFAILEGRFS